MRDPEVTVLDLLLELTVLLGDDMRRGLGALGLTEKRAHVLVALHQGGPATQRELADLLEVSARTVTTLVDDLETADLVRRGPHPSDRRAVLVGLVGAGETLAAGLLSGQVELAHQLLDGLDLDAFHQVLVEVVARLRAAVAR